MGGELRIGPFNYLQLAGGSGTFAFDNRFTANNPFTPAGGYGYASYLLGTGASGSITTSQPISGQQIYRALYFQDDWRVSRKLTLNLGVRWDLAGPWSERYDRLSVFLPNADSPLAQQVKLPLKGKFALVNTPEFPGRTSVPSNKKLFAPRVGFAYQLTPKTMLRSGYGIFYIPNALISGADPHSDVVNSQANTWVPTIDNIVPFTLFNNPFPNGLQQPSGRDPNFEQRYWGSSPATFYPNSGYGYMQQWNFNVQRELPFGVFVDAAYAGAKGTHLPVGFQVDQLPDQYLALGQQLSRQVANPFFGIVNQGILQTATISQGQLLRPFPQFNGVTLPQLYDRDIVLPVVPVESPAALFARREPSGGLHQFQADHDRRRLLTGASGNRRGLLGLSELQQFQSRTRALVVRRLAAAGGQLRLDLPFGHGQALLARRARSGVETGVGLGAGGDRDIPKRAADPCHRDAEQDRFAGRRRAAELDRDERRSWSGSAQSRLNRWFDTSQFKQPAAFTFGNVARNLPDVRSAGINNWDLAFAKTTVDHGAHRPAVPRGVFQSVQPGAVRFPGQVLGNASFGVVSSQVNQPRLLQFSLRLQW